MGQGTITVCFDPVNLSFEQGNSFAQFIMRIAIKALGGEQAGRIVARAGAIIIVHVANFERRALAVNSCWR